MWKLTPKKLSNSIVFYPTLVSLNFSSQNPLIVIKVCFYNIYNEVLDINSNLFSFCANSSFWKKKCDVLCSWRVKRTNWRTCCIITWWRRGTASSTTSRKCRWLTAATSWISTRRSSNRRTRNSSTSRSKLKVGTVRPNRNWIWSCSGTAGLCCHTDLFYIPILHVLFDFSILHAWYKKIFDIWKK